MDYDNTGNYRMPTAIEYEWRRQYPRLYFDSLKLKEEELAIYINHR